MNHSVTVKVDAVDPSDGYPYRGKIFHGTTHELELAWWMGSPKITEVIDPCACGAATTVTARPFE